ncbi:MAG: metallophosphoesterase [Candidatus Ozemobacteraceae bacterium]
MGKKDQLLLLHLSDIHFREPYCLNPDTDQDHPVRKALTNDISQMVARLGNVDAIIVSGDIAYHGKAREYKIASKWFSEVIQISQCPEQRLYTVPGNHDVNRTLAGSREVLGARVLVSNSELGPDRDKELHDTFLEERSGNHLLTPMGDYNEFSAQFGCDLSPKRPFWTDELPITPGWTLKMHGLTSTFFSGPDDDKEGGLFLGALQRVFSPDNGIVRLALFHHPPDWLSDKDAFDDALWENCSLHLFGHKHRNRYRTGDKGIRLAAGAVNPSRKEGNWEPGYNLVCLNISEVNGSFFLNTKCYLRIWQDNPDQFIGKKDRAGKEEFEHSVRLWNKPVFLPPPKEMKVPMEKEDKKPKPEETVLPREKEPMDVSTFARSLVFNFWQFSPSERRKIMQQLGLLEEADDELPETQQYRRAFERANDRNLISELNSLVNQLKPK